MAWEQNPYALKLTCSPDVSTLGGQVANTNFSAPMSIFRFVYLTGAANPNTNQNVPLVATVSAINTRPLGVMQNSPKARYNAAGAVSGVDEAEVTISGITKVEAGGVIPVGSPITVDASGRAIAAGFGSISAAGQVTSASVTSTVPTYTVSNASATNPYSVGQVVTIAGITGSGTTLNFTNAVITAVAGSSAAWTFTLGNVTTAALGTPTYTSGTVSGSSSFCVGTAISPAAASGDIITAAVACHNAARAA
jgi:hypothetical protein